MSRTTTLFTNGALFDGHRSLGDGEVLVAEGRIAEVRLGTDRIDRTAADITDVVDLAGGLLAPGFVDAHVHAVQGGLERIRCDLTPGGTRDDYLRLIAEYAAAHPSAPWILGGGWAMTAFPGGSPTAADLDAVVPDRPVFLPNRDHHGAWVNSAALELAGLDRHTPDPADGRFERDADGRPTGTLHEGAMAAVARLVPETTEAEYYSALFEGQRHLHSLGITGWQDAIIGAYSGMGDVGPTYLRAAQRGELTAHVVGALWWDRDRGIEQVADLVARRAEYTSGRFRATSVKIMQDGIAENYTASMLAPYLDRCGHSTRNSGHSFVPGDALREYVARLDAEGFQVHVHAIGDRGTREALDAFTGTDAARRHHIAHLQFVHLDDLGRFADLGVAANLQMLWACLDDQMVDLTIPFVGEERAGRQYPFGDLVRAGARLVAGSDWPVSTANPLEAIHVAVNRTAHGETGPAGTRPFLPEQSLPLETAFAAYTSGSAWINHRDVDGGAGVLRRGAAADLVILDRNPFQGPPGEIATARVTSTWVDGEPVHGH
jgi:predicted amidohydrolase YtcJ